MRRSPRELSREIRLAAAMVWYTEGRISHEKAARFAGASRIDFIDALTKARLHAFHVDLAELMEEVALARLLSRSERRHIIWRSAWADAGGSSWLTCADVVPSPGRREPGRDRGGGGGPPRIRRPPVRSDPW
ncbi:MAG: UPF0175 family protein [Isosphaeraceae bacterium]